MVYGAVCRSTPMQWERRAVSPAAVTEASSGLSFKHLEWSPGVSMWPLRAFWQFISWLRRPRDPCLKVRSCRSVCWRGGRGGVSVYLYCMSLVVCFGVSMHTFEPTVVSVSFTPACNLISNTCHIMNPKWCYSFIKLINCQLSVLLPSLWFQINRLHWIMVSLETQKGGWVEAPPNHLSAKRINNAGWPSITHSDLDGGGPAWDGAYHTARRSALWKLNSSSRLLQKLLSKRPVSMNGTTADYSPL